MKMKKQVLFILIVIFVISFIAFSSFNAFSYNSKVDVNNTKPITDNERCELGAIKHYVCPDGFKIKWCECKEVFCKPVCKEVIEKIKKSMPIAMATAKTNVGWYDSCTNELIKKANYSSCKDHKAVCKNIGTEKEGWYDYITNELIKYEKCTFWNCITNPEKLCIGHGFCYDNEDCKENEKCQDNRCIKINLCEQSGGICRFHCLKDEIEDIELSKYCNLQTELVQRQYRLKKCCIPKIIEKNVKNLSRYYKDEAFLISDKNWEDVLSLVPVTIWTENGKIVKYPTLIYHQENGSFDADSVIHFLQMYKPKKLTIVGSTPQELDNLLVTEPELGAGLNESQIQRILPSDYLSYWNSYKDIVYVERNYKLSLLASVYASLINAPLVINKRQEVCIQKEKCIAKGGKCLSDTVECEIGCYCSLPLDISIFKDKNVVLVGNVSCPSNAMSCERFTSEEQLQRKYIEVTNTTKIILVNPNDLNDIYLEKEFLPGKSAMPIYNLFGKHSLAAPILAAAKHELILLDDIPGSPENPGTKGDNESCERDRECISGQCVNGICINTEEVINKIKENVESTEELIENKVEKLFENKNRAEYLTIIASPKAIPDSIYSGAYWSSQVRKERDTLYGKEPDTPASTPVSILIDSNRLHILTTNGEELLYTKANLNGNILTKKTINCEDKAIGIAAVEVSSDNNLHLVTKCENELHYFKIDNNGNILRNGTFFISDLFDNIETLKIGVDSKNNVHVVWILNTLSGKKLYYAKLDNEGNLLINPMEVANFSKARSNLKIVIDSSDKIHVIILEETEFKIKYLKLDNEGHILINKIIEPNAKPKNLHFDVDIDKINNIHLIYSNFSSKDRIIYLKLDKNGTKILEKVIFSDIFAGVGVRGLSMSTDKENNVHISWEASNNTYNETSEFQISEFQIFYMKLDNNGSVLTDVTQLTFNDSNEIPKIVANENKVYIIWKKTKFEEIYSSFPYYIKLNTQWSNPIELDRFLFNLKVGRIYGIDTSDVSSYIARTIFYEKLVAKLYNETEFTGLAIGRKEGFFLGPAIEASIIKRKTKLSGYNSSCFTDSYCLVDNCFVYRIGLDPNNFKGKQFITFVDHGWHGGWAFTIVSTNLPWMDLPLSLNVACSTNNFWQGSEITFGMRFLRKGGIGYPGAVGVTTFDTLLPYIKFLTQEKRVTLGELNDFRYSNSLSYRATYTFLGDPTLKPKFKKVDWTILDQCEDGIDNDGDGFVDYPNDMGCYSPNDNNETNPPECMDCRDNDNDGFVDYPMDPECTSYEDNSEAE